MILIADSGTTKTDWRLTCKGATIGAFKTSGVNPYFQTEDEITAAIDGELFSQFADYEQITHLFFYGAGCTPEKNAMMSKVFSRLFPNAATSIFSDLMAAAHALCGREAGIACIMGTGSNSCFYDGAAIVKNIPPLGYILGDEGGGVSLGRRLVSDILKDMTSPTLKKKFFDKYQLTAAQIIECVYRQPFPNRFLAGFSPFLAENLAEPEIYGIVYDCFKSFFVRNVMKYDYKSYPAHFAGSVAANYLPVLKQVAADTGVKIGKIHKSPLEGLIEYYNYLIIKDE